MDYQHRDIARLLYRETHATASVTRAAGSRNIYLLQAVGSDVTLNLSSATLYILG